MRHDVRRLAQLARCATVVLLLQAKAHGEEVAIELIRGQQDHSLVDEDEAFRRLLLLPRAACWASKSCSRS